MPPKVPKGPTKWTIAFEAELAARRAREEAVRFCTVYYAKHEAPLHARERDVQHLCQEGLA